MTAVSLILDRSKQLLAWQQATWEDYLRLRDHHEILDTPHVKIFFYDGALLADDMGWEGINHATVRELFNFIFLFWFAQHPEQSVATLGGALFEKDGKGAGSPDLMLYVGEGHPQWVEGESRKIDLNCWRAPDLVGEISDTTLASDLDQKKRLYASLGIAEYWVVDVKGSQVFLFQLDDQGTYCESQTSSVLTGLTISLLEEVLSKLNSMTNMDAALWFQKQIA